MSSLFRRFRLIVDLLMVLLWGTAASFGLRVMAMDREWRVSGPIVVSTFIAFAFAMDFKRIAAKEPGGIKTALAISSAGVVFCLVALGVVLGSLGMDIHWRGFRR